MLCCVVDAVVWGGVCSLVALPYRVCLELFGIVGEGLRAMRELVMLPQPGDAANLKFRLHFAHATNFSGTPRQRHNFPSCREERVQAELTPILPSRHFPSAPRRSTSGAPCAAILFGPTTTPAPPAVCPASLSALITE